MSNHLIWVVGLTNIWKYFHLTEISWNYETSFVYQELLNIESFSWHGFTQDLLVVSIWLTQDKLSLVSSYQNLSFMKPAMCCVVSWKVSTLFLAESFWMELEVVILCSEEFVGIVTSYKDVIGIHVTKWDLSTNSIASWMGHVLMWKAPCLVYRPKENFLLWLIRKSDKKSIIFWSKSHWDEWFLDVNLLW